MTDSPYSTSSLRRNTVEFLAGKAVSAIATVVLTLWLVRLLSLEEYAAYITLLAAADTVIVISALGLHWLAARYLPEVRLNASGEQLGRFVRHILLWQLAALAVVGAILLVVLGPLLEWVNLERHRSAALVYIAVCVLEGMSRFVREALLGPLLLQGSIQISVLVRSLSMLIVLLLVQSAADVNLRDVVYIELVATCVGLSVALYFLLRALTDLARVPGRADWRRPLVREMWPMALRMYLAHLVSFVYGAQVLTLLLQRFVGAEATATFGFLRTLFDQLARYLPASLLFSLVRPKLVAAYLVSGSIRRLAESANLCGKISLFVLMPFVALGAAWGSSLVALASGDKFGDTGYLLLAFMLTLVPFSQRQLLETVAVTTGHEKLCIHAASAGLLSLPLAFAMMDVGMGVWSAVFSLGAGQFLFTGIVIIGLSRLAGYRTDWAGMGKLCALALSSAAAAGMIDALLPGDSNVLRGALLVGGLYVLFSWWIKPFTPAENDKINLFLGRRVFVW